MNKFLKYHNLNLDDKFFQALVSDPTLIDLPKDFLSDKLPQQRADLIIGEYLYMLYENLGEITSKLLKRGQWSYQTPDWFDHRHHAINWKEESKNSWTESASLVLRYLSEGDKILNLCAGDAYYDSRFFHNMASSIDCIDINNTDSYKNYLIHQNIKNCSKIKYMYGNILEINFTQNFYDIVIMRSAIEHFSEENQIKLFEKINNSLKINGIYIGDTPANPDKYKHKQHSAHENEWLDEKEAHNTLSKYFRNVEVYTIYCNIDQRNTIFWKAQK